MNIVIISAMSDEGKNLDCEGSPYEGFTGLYANVDGIVIGEILKFRHILYKYSLFVNVVVNEHSLDETTGIHTIKTNDGTIVFEELDYGKKKTKKKINSTLYMGARLGRHSFDPTAQPNRYLLSQGKYPTKIYASDLPPWYVFGYLYKRHGYISAKGVKHLWYKPNYLIDNHYLKYDYLFVSYDEPIIPVKSDNNFSWFEGYEHCLSGGIIVDFIEAVEKYSDYDVTEIKKELERKKEWYYRQREE